MKRWDDDQGLARAIRENEAARRGRTGRRDIDLPKREEKGNGSRQVRGSVDTDGVKEIMSYGVSVLATVEFLGAKSQVQKCGPPA